MHVNVQLRYNPAVGEEAPYYRIKESYRDVRGNVHSLILLNIGFEPSLRPIQMKRIASHLTSRLATKDHVAMSFFKDPMDNLSQNERAKAEEYWNRMVSEGGIDRFKGKEAESCKEAENYVEVNTIEHTDARNVGAEWICKQAIDSLGLEDFLHRRGWSENGIRTAMSHLIVRTVYAPSGLGTLSVMRDTSAACPHRSWSPPRPSMHWARRSTSASAAVRRNRRRRYTTHSNTKKSRSNDVKSVGLSCKLEKAENRCIAKKTDCRA
jgi:hypothetical protein